MSLLWLSSGTYTWRKKYDPQCCIAFSWPAFMIEYRPSLNWEERIRVCLIMEHSGDGFAVHWWWFLCSFLKKVWWGKDGLLLINKLWRWRSSLLFLILPPVPLVSHFNIIAADDFKLLLFELTQNIFISMGKKFKDGQENTKHKCKPVTKWKFCDHMSCYVYRAGKDFDLGVLWWTHTPAFQN